MGGGGVFLKRRGTLGTLGILARFLGKYERFSRVPKDANGTLDLSRGSEAGSWSPDAVMKREKNVGGLGGLGGLALFLGKYAGFKTATRPPSGGVGKKVVSSMRFLVYSSLFLVPFERRYLPAGR
jgi:hypothetical protein